MVLIRCNYCSKDFERKQSEVNRNKSGVYFCSQECFRLNSTENYEKRLCISCNVELSYKQVKQRNIFCSRNCSVRFNNSSSPKRKLEGTCRVCGKIISKAKTYCSKDCHNESRRSLESSKERKSNGYYVKNFIRRQKLKAVEYKGGKCQLCGYDKSVKALCFHHRVPAEKSFNISGCSISWDRLVLELDKCDLLCANCHAEIH